MSVKALTICIFQPHESHAVQLQSLFANRSHYHIREVESVHEIARALEEEGLEIDAIVVPFVLSDRSPGVTLCLQLRSHENLVGIPILAIAAGKDTPAISTMYGAGADVVIAPPIEGELVYAQLSALRRFRRAVQEELKVGARDFGLRQAMVSALHFVEDSVIILNTEQEIVFINRAARELLRIYSTNDATLIGKVTEPITRSIRAEIDSGRVSADLQALPSLQVILKRADGNEFSADIRITSFRAPDDRLIAYGATIRDLTTPREISATLKQVERLNSLSLLLAAACHHLLNSPTLGEPGNGLARIERLLVSQLERSSLVPVVTAVLEFLDLIISSRTSLKVNMPKDYAIAMKPADLYQLSGHLVLYAVRFAGHKGEIGLRSEESKKSGSVVLRINAIGDSEIFSAREKQTTAMVRAKFLGLQSGQSGDSRSDRLTDTLYFGVIVAQEIARSYGIDLREERPGEREMVLSVTLPIAAS